jgi:putative flippase GtrA
LQSIMNRLKKYQFLIFIVAGGTAATFNFISRIILSMYISYSISIIIAYVIGMVIAFSLNRLFVFNTDNRVVRQVVLFTVVNLVGITQTYFISIYLANHLFHHMNLNCYPEEVAHFIGISIPTFTSYIGHKFLTFSTVERKAS